MNLKSFLLINIHIIKKIIRKTSFLKPVKKSKLNLDKIITLDIETRVVNNIITPYCICYYDGINYSSFYLTDYKDSQDMIKNVIISLLVKKYNNYTVYIHNLAHFDGIFLIKTLASLDDCELKPTLKDGKMINLKLIYPKGIINFRDSLLLLPNSLSKLAKSFNIQDKGIFPYKFVNESVPLDYNSIVPSYLYFDNVSEEKYNEYLNKSMKWNLQYETISYCNQDCYILYKVIISFGIYIHNSFKLDINKYPTLPSLAFAIFRCHYLKDYKIPLLSGKIFSDVRKSYTGGATDMFKPYGETVFRYDVNSLYPSVMKEYPIPTGNITIFEGDITLIEPNAFGFFEVEITSPDELNIPLLQTKVNIKNGIRTVAPLGKWKGMYFSEELYNSSNYGYIFKNC
jgi:hypothetical protein